MRWLANMRDSSALLGEPERLVHIGDRENDIYEFFCAAREVGTHFVVRTCVDHLAGSGGHTIAAEMAEVAVQELHRVEIAEDAFTVLELRYKRIRVLPPIGKQKRYPALDLTVIHARERDEPADRPRIDWRLITNLRVERPEDAVEKLVWYSMRWKIEVVHKILKSERRAEEARLRTAERLVNLIAVMCILSWRLFWMTMMNRAAPDAPPSVVLAPHEDELLDHLAARRGSEPRPYLATYLGQIARLGGYLGRTRDPPPGNIVMWRGWSRFMDISLGANLVCATYR